jgi:hypothetical protein
MDIHTPKPWHGLREFLKEWGIIVVGVLTALAAEQIVQALDWRHKVDVAVDAMRAEVGDDDAPELHFRAVLHPCLQGRLDDIRSAVEAGKSRDEVANLISGYKLLFLSFDSLALNAANASDVTTHIPNAELQKWMNIYSMMPLLDRTNAKEAGDVAGLRSLRRTGGPLSDVERDRAVQAVEALRQDDNLMYGAITYVLPEIEKAGIALTPKRKASFMVWARKRYGACIQDLPPDWATKEPPD